MLAIKNWDNHNLGDYYNEKEFVALVKWTNSNSTSTNALNESTKPPTTQPGSDPYDLLLDSAIEELNTELEQLKLARGKRKELA